MRLTIFGTILLGICMVLPADAGLMLSRKGGVEIWSEPVESPADGYLATEIYLKTSRDTLSSARMTTFTNLSIEGGLVQSWGHQPTPYLPTSSEVMPPLDSHLLLSRAHVAGDAGHGFFGISETNDKSMDATTGFGGIEMQESTDAFFLTQAHQGDELPLARLVTTETAEPILLTVGVLGTGISNWPHGASFEDVPVHFAAVPEPETFLGLASGLLAFASCRRRS